MRLLLLKLEEISTMEFGIVTPWAFIYLYIFVFVVACLFQHSDFSAFLIYSFNSTFISMFARTMLRFQSLSKNDYYVADMGQCLALHRKT